MLNDYHSDIFVTAILGDRLVILMTKSFKFNFKTCAKVCDAEDCTKIVSLLSNKHNSSK